MTDRTILVTGSTRGIGRAIALALANSGFEVVIHGVSNATAAAAVEAEVRALGRRSRTLLFDVADRDACEQQLARELESNGPLYGVVLAAGIARDAAFPAISGADWDAVLRTNLDGFYNVLNPVTMSMIGAHRGGRIVTLSSVAGLAGNRGQVNYSAAKAGIIGATKALAVELAKRNITVNCVAPGVIDTDMVNEQIRSAALPLIPMQRLGRPEEVAALVSFLCSDAASYITRQVFSINGGML
jgi:3-oxoacyl-[acyl-carrier protein] reductase